MRTRFTALAVAVAALVAMQSSQAVVLDQDTFTPLPGTTAAAEPNLAGVVLADTVNPFSFSAYGGTVSGTVQSRVVREDGTGTLDFYWRVISDGESAGGIGSFRIGNFVVPAFDANYRLDGLGDTGPGAGYAFSAFPNDMNFEFTRSTAGSLDAGHESFFMFLHTNATSFNATGLYDLTNVGQTQISGEYWTYAPAVPEPETYALLLAGLAGMGFVARRRRAS